MSEARVSTLVIATPEGVTFSLPLAGPVPRALAFFLDAVIMITVLRILALFLNPFAKLLGDFGAGGYFLMQCAFMEVSRACCELLWRGQTPGKKVFGLRVVDEGGLKLRPLQVIVRNLLRCIDILPGCYAVGGAVCFLNRRSQRLGDLAAGTVVLRSVHTTPPDVASLLSGKYNSFRATPHLEARLRQKVTPEEAQLALQALLRREDLEPAARISLYARLAAHLREKVRFPDEAVFGLSDEQYVRNVVDTLFRKRT